MLSLLMYVFIFFVVVILFVLFALGLFISRAQKKQDPSKTDPNIIDVQAIDADEAAEISSTDLLLHP